jgi:hypothetical protein
MIFAQTQGKLVRIGVIETVFALVEFAIACRTGSALIVRLLLAQCNSTITQLQAHAFPAVPQAHTPTNTLTLA